MRETVEGILTVDDTDDDFAEWSEAALLEYVHNHAGIDAESARYDPRYDWIVYIYDTEVEDQEKEPAPEWSDRYLHHIGMAMSDFL